MHGRVFIPTRGRRHRQVTIQSLDIQHGDVTMVVPFCEAHLWTGWDVLQVSDDHRNGDICQDIMEGYPDLDYHLVLDDDLRWLAWNGGPVTTKMLVRDVERFFEDDSTITLVGFAHDHYARSRLALDTWVVNGPVHRAIAYRPKPYLDMGFKYGEFMLCEDKHMILATRLRGWKIARSHSYGHVDGYKPTMKPEDGGIATYRTPEVVQADREKLKRMYPDYVTIDIHGKAKINWRKLNRATLYPH